MKSTKRYEKKTEKKEEKKKKKKTEKKKKKNQIKNQRKSKTQLIAVFRTVCFVFLGYYELGAFLPFPKAG